MSKLFYTGKHTARTHHIRKLATFAGAFAVLTGAVAGIDAAAMSITPAGAGITPAGYVRPAVTVKSLERAIVTGATVEIDGQVYRAVRVSGAAKLYAPCATVGAVSGAYRCVDSAKYGIEWEYAN